MIYYFSEKYFPAHKKKATLQEIFNFVKIEEESLPQAWGRLLRLLNASPDDPLKKNEILDIFYNGLTDASRDHLDSYVGCVFRERTVEQAELLLNNILSNVMIGHFLNQLPSKLRRKGVLYFSVLRYARGKEIYERKRY